MRNLLQKVIPWRKLTHKQVLRKTASSNRKKISKHAKETYSQIISETFLSLPLYQKASIIHCYHNTSHEVFTQKIFQQSLIDKKRVFVPIVDNVKSRRLIHREIHSLQDLTNVRPFTEDVATEMDMSSELFAQILSPQDIIIVPLIGFDENLNRIGYGFGFYDQFLKHTYCTKIGLAFETQKVANILKKPWDISLDMIITEDETYTVTANSILS